MYTADAKLGFDDNASFRQRSIFDMEDTTESEPREVEAAKHNLNYVQVKFSKLIFIFFFWKSFTNSFKRGCNVMNVD